MVRAALPQFFIGNIQTNSNFAPEGEEEAGGVVPADWFDTDWNCRVPITVNANQVPSMQTDFPFLFNSTVPEFVDAQSLGQDFRFVLQDKTQLKYEIQDFDSGTNTLIAWTKVPSIEVGTLIYLYFNNPTATDNQDPAAVYDSNYKAVWHMNETVFGIDSIKDSTSNNNDGDPSPGITSTTGQIGRAINFDGNSVVAVFVSPSLDIFGPTAEITLEGWMKTNDIAIPHLGGMICHPVGPTWPTAGEFAQYCLRQANSRFQYFSDPISTMDLASANGTISIGPFFHLAATYSSSTNMIKLYRDGSLLATKSSVTALWTSSTEDILLGRDHSSLDEFFDGILDELRVSDIARSDDFIETEFNNQSAPETFYDRGPVTCIGPVIDQLMIYTGGVGTQMIYTGGTGVKMQYQ